MRRNFLRKLSKMGCVSLLFTLTALAQEHKWAGRTLDAVEWTVHEKLAAPPFHGVFDTLDKYAGRPASPIHIIVKDGWVTLEGVVDSDADRSLVHQRALEVTAHASENLRVAGAGLP
jgi:hypothetical protein